MVPAASMLGRDARGAYSNLDSNIGATPQCSPKAPNVLASVACQIDFDFPAASPNGVAWKLEGCNVSRHSCRYQCDCDHVHKSLTDHRDWSGNLS